MPRRKPLAPRLLAAAGVLLVAAAVFSALLFTGGRGAVEDQALAVERPFDQVITCRGRLLPRESTSVFPKLRGTLIEIVDDGALVAAGDVLFRIDPRQKQDELAAQEASLLQIQADREKETQTAAKELRRAQDEIRRREYRVELETVRLGELRSGPTAADLVNAQTARDNSALLLEARKEELVVLEELGREGYIAAGEVRLKRLEVVDQGVDLASAELALRKLKTPDPIVLAEQEMRVKDERKNLEAVKARAAVLEADAKQAEFRHTARMKREERRREELREELRNATVAAPGAGVAVVGRSWWGQYRPGIRVYEGAAVLSLSDPGQVRVVATVDEGRYALVQEQMKARIRPLGRTKAEHWGKVARVFEQGSDEFTAYRGETQDITGRAERMMFDAEIEFPGRVEGLRPGACVNVDLFVRKLPQAVVVPRAAVRFDGVECYVLEVRGASSVRRNVKILAENAADCALAGLEAGRRVWLRSP